MSAVTSPAPNFKSAHLPKARTMVSTFFADIEVP